MKRLLIACVDVVPSSRNSLVVAIAILATLQSHGKPEEQTGEDGKYVVSRVTPLYPRDAQVHRLEGAGIFQLSIDRESGAVTDVATIKTSGWKLLDRSAIAAFRKWRFVPHTVSKVNMPINFGLVGKQSDQLKDARRNAIVSPVPTYPFDAWRYSVGGLGAFQLVVNYETGVVQDVKPIETTGDGRLDKAAITAFRKWRFRPHSTHTFVVRYRFF